MNATMTRDEIKAELARIGSTYTPSKGWTHCDPKGRDLVKQLVALNNAVTATKETRPAAWGPKGGRGTVICGHCGRRGQEIGTVCDCGSAVRG